MPKQSFQDVVPPERRSIRNIPITTRKRAPEHRAPLMHRSQIEQEIKREEIEEESEVRGYEAVMDRSDREAVREMPRKKSSASKIFVAVAGVFIIGFIFLMMNVFTSANVKISPKQEEASFNMEVLATSMPVNPTSTTTSLKYEVIELSKQGEKEVAANGEENVENKASGKIVVYNNFSEEPQRLIARTRFETPEGLIFRINDSVTVPGKAGSTPGSITVTVYADEAGEKYNVGLKDFTIPGFKDDAVRYKGFYARSKDKIEGGFIGKVKKVAKTEADAANLELDNSLKSDLSKEILSKIPENLVVLNGATVYDFDSLPQADSGSKVMLKREGKVYAVAFDKQALSTVIENQFLKNWDGVPAEILSFDKVSLTINDPAWSPEAGGNVSVKIAGSADFVASVDTSALSSALAGKNRTELANVVNNNRAIDSAEVSIRPIWKSTFPSDAAKINIQITP